MDHEKVAIIIPYFGTLPNYFDLWLESVRENEFINVFFFSNNNKPINCPSNIHWKRTSFCDVKKKIQSLFDFSIVLDTPYKLVDYKPTYGIVFEKYIENYEWWGWGDIDTIWGNLSLIINENTLKKYDKILDLGHLTLMKNNYKMKNLWKEKVLGAWTYEDAFKSNMIYHFDEGGGLAFIAQKAKCKVYSEKPNEMNFADILPYKYDFELAYNQKEKNIPHIFTWKNGILIGYWIQNNKMYSKEYAYIHLQKRRMELQLKSKKYNQGFIIIPNRFIPYDKKITTNLILKFQNNQGLTNPTKKISFASFLNYLEYTKFKLKSKKRHIPINGNEVYFKIEKPKY